MRATIDARDGDALTKGAARDAQACRAAMRCTAVPQALPLHM
ncbi:hypothetical protein BURMUCF2_A1744 [Burkholderia multivorans CF2]|nr:hypothetical protein BURMUCF2_A1744 [Burkholderia multivorans CF2]